MHLHDDWKAESWDDDESDSDGIDDGDIDDDESSEVVSCPECGAEVYEDAEQCPECGNYIIHAAARPWSGKPLWWVILGILGVATVILALIL